MEGIIHVALLISTTISLYQTKNTDPGYVESMFNTSKMDDPENKDEKTLKYSIIPKLVGLQEPLMTKVVTIKKQDEVKPFHRTSAMEAALAL